MLRFPQQLVVPEAETPTPPDPAAVAQLRAIPAMLAEGMRDTALLPRYVIPAFRAAFPEAPVVELADAGHFTPEDAPDALLALLELFLQTTRQSFVEASFLSARAQLLLLATGMFALGTDGYVITGLLPDVARELAVTESAAGQLVTVFALAYALGGAPARCRDRRAAPAPDPRTNHPRAGPGW